MLKRLATSAGQTCYATRDLAAAALPSVDVAMAAAAVRDQDLRRDAGRRGEEAAVRYLERCGFEVLARNYRCRYGEIDLVARDGPVVVFVEVKLRYGGADPLEAVDARKQRHISRVAFDFLRRHGMLACPARFDVVAVQGATGTCLHVADAFDTTLDY